MNLKDIAKKHGVCDLEYSIKLKELGEPQEGLWYWTKFFKESDFSFSIVSKALSSKCYECYLAYTVAELGERLPRFIGYYDLPWLEIRKEENFKTKKIYWVVAYKEYISCQKEPETTIDFEADTEANARAKMKIYLLENKLIK